jgi:hypothetical protein
MKTSLAHFRMVFFLVTFAALSTCLVYGQLDRVTSKNSNVLRRLA